MKGSWQGTACYYKVIAKDPATAKDITWKKIARTEGGNYCLRVDVVREIV